MTKPEVKLSIIIVSYNTSLLLKRCLQSVFVSLSAASLVSVSEVIVVDNASKDDSPLMVATSFPQVRLIVNKHNLGFASANNQGMRISKGEYILLLNSDTEVLQNTMHTMLYVASHKNDVDVIGFKLLNSDGTIQPSAGFFPDILRVFYWMTFIDDIPYLTHFLQPYHVSDRTFYEKSRYVDWASGACMLIKRNILQTVGYFDEKIFMYGEEVEWCYRIKNSGFHILFCPEAVIYHLKGSSSLGKNSGIIDEFSSLLYFYKKHKSYPQMLILRGILIFGALLRIIVFGIIFRSSNKAALYAKAITLVR